MKVYIVEDDTITQMYLEHMLRNEGHEVVGYSVSGEDAILRIEKSEAELVLMDIELQGKMNGIDTATQIRAKSNIPFVFITGNSDRVKSDERIKLIDPLAVLIKPVMSGDLSPILASIIS